MIPGGPGDFRFGIQRRAAGTPPPAVGDAFIAGPYPVGFADIPNDGDQFSVVAVPSGMVMASWWSDPDTHAGWPGSIMLGQGPEFEANPNGLKGTLGDISNPAGSGGAVDGELISTINFRYNRAGVNVYSAALIPSAAGDIKAANNSGLTVGAGRDDLYFLFGTPVAAATVTGAMIAGPCTVGFADIAANGSVKTLFTMPAGMALVSWWNDPDQHVDWYKSAVFATSVYVGEGATFAANPATGDILGIVYYDGEVNAGYTSMRLPLTGAPVGVGNASGGTLTAGHDVFYFLLAAL